MPHEYEAQDGDYRTTAFPAIVRANGTTAPVSGMAFDPTTEEALFFRFRASDYTSGNVVVDLDWYADTATSGAVVWGVQLGAITANTDTTDIETKALSTVAKTTTTHLGTTGQRLHRTTVTVTAVDSLAANDHAVIRVARYPADAGDTMTGDAILTIVAIAA